MPALRRGRRWQAPEVVQTSAMDCGPAALKCVLEGFGITASYGRLREACQTDVDGTSIDTLEAIAPLMGVEAEQLLVPIDHVLLSSTQALPAILVLSLADGAAHFTVLWRAVGPWLQLMDPATGRRWLHRDALLRQLHRHEHGVSALDWRAWAGGPEFQQALALRMVAIGVSGQRARALLDRALADPTWFGCAALDASLRLASSVVWSAGSQRGDAAARLVTALFERCLGQPDDIHATVPAACWSVMPDPAGSEETGPLLRLQGTVLLRFSGRRADAATEADRGALSPELRAALSEAPLRPLQQAWGLMRHGGVLAPAALLGAMLVAAAGIVVETLLLRGVVDIGNVLPLPMQRVGAVLALVGFAALLLVFEAGIVRESMRHGRQLELRLRMALLTKLPRLGDRYFQSRSVSDMADRGHSIQLTRQMPTLGLHLAQTAAELLFTLLGLALLAPASLGWALAIVAASLLWPLLLQPVIGERDLRVRNQASALHGFYLDALLGSVPLRTHHAGAAVRRQHETLLVGWSRAGGQLIRTAVAADALQSLGSMALAAGLLWRHFTQAGTVGGGDLLLVYWVLKLPALGHGLAGLLRQVPAQRNVMGRLLEPLGAPQTLPAAGAPAPRPPTAGTRPPPLRGMAIELRGGRVLAGGHELLRDLDLRLRAGEHVAVVGASGAGKSSLVGLLMGWHRLSEGELTVDGGAWDDAAQDRLRRATAWVDPGVQLWNRPLLDNLLYASADTMLAQVGPVLEAAELRGVVQKLPQGLQTPLGEGGALLSGGEGQRVRLARALLQDEVRLVLLDEAFRGLDRGQRTRQLAQARRHWASATLLCVTHDISDTLDFDRVLVINGGEVVEDGRPQALARTDTRYARLLEAEAALGEDQWRNGHWRRIDVRGGRIVGPGTAA